MAVNYAEKYAAVIDEKFSEESRTEAAINKDYDFTGVNKVNVYSIPAVPLQDYNMTAQSNRYGTPVELGSDVQTLELTQDKSFTFTIDRRNNTDTQMQISAANALARQLRDVIAPTVDKYRLAKLVENAPEAHVKEETLSSSNAYSAFLDASMTLFDSHVPPEGRISFVSPEFYKAVKLDKSFTGTGDKAQEIAVKGAVGVIDKTAIIAVPTDYLPANVNFIITHPAAMTSPIKIADYKQHENPQGINGWLVEGRIYYDAFVLKNKKSAIYVSTKKKTAAAPPETETPGNQG